MVFVILHSENKANEKIFSKMESVMTLLEACVQ